MIKAFIFDLDGTLIDTEKIYRQVWPKAIADVGYTMSDEMYLEMRSMGRPFALERFRRDFGEGFDYDRARQIRKGYFEEYINKNGIQLKKGALELLTFLRAKGIMTAIATATDPERARQYLKMSGLHGYIDKLISATMVDEGKPSPKVYAFACSELGFAPEECIAVEDAPNGVISAHGAGLRVIMVPDLTPPDDKMKSLAYDCVESLEDIKNEFENKYIY